MIPAVKVMDNINESSIKTVFIDNSIRILASFHQEFSFESLEIDIVKLFQISKKEKDR